MTKITKEQFHLIWSHAIGKPRYSKKLFQRLEMEFEKLGLFVNIGHCDNIEIINDANKPYYFEHEIPAKNTSEVFEILIADYKCCECGQYLYDLCNRSSKEIQWLLPFERFRKIPENHEPYLIIESGKRKIICKNCYKQHNLNIK